MKPQGFRAPRVQANPDTVYDREFKDFLPGQVEHCLRLTLERLQKNHRELSTHDIAALSQSVVALYEVYVDTND